MSSPVESRRSESESSPSPHVSSPSPSPSPDVKDSSPSPARSGLESDSSPSPRTRVPISVIIKTQFTYMRTCLLDSSKNTEVTLLTGSNRMGFLDKNR